ncbi:MAG: CopG family transcriptional regulator [Oscillospiraceae bacterium]
MSPRTGRPPKENTLDTRIQIRADKQLVEDLNYCCEKLSLNRSDVVRMGIQKVKKEVEEKK